jgi:predicted nucleic acid-binding protein
VVVSGWLVDKSALSRLGSSSDRDSWSNRIERGLVRISTVTLLEVGFSARSADDWDSAIRQAPVDRMPLEYLSPLIEQRALAVQRELATRGQHRGPGGADLLIAATAEVAGLIVLHVDSDFELIAAVTGQPVERLAAAG